MKALALATDPVLVEIVEGHPTTTSLDVATHFGKRHADVIRAIKKLDCSEEFTERNFALSEYKDATGRSVVQYRMTRDGFTFLCMGFTGKDAASWKEAYIQAFNRLEATLAKQALPAQPTITNLRWLVSVDRYGKEQVTAVPNDARIMTQLELLQAIGSANRAIFTTAELFDIAMASLGQIRARNGMPGVRFYGVEL